MYDNRRLENDINTSGTLSERPAYLGDGVDWSNLRIKWPNDVWPKMLKLIPCHTPVCHRSHEAKSRWWKAGSLDAIKEQST